MKHWLRFGIGMVFVCVLAFGCSSKNSKDQDDGGGPDSRYLLQQEPPGALSVKEAKTRIKDGDDVTIIGRIGGKEDPWYDGLAGFLVVDLSCKSCLEIEGDNCPKPWDYCCEDADELLKGTASVKVVDADGAPIRTDARKLLGVTELQTIVAQGKAKRDDGGNLIVHVSGVFVRPEKKK